MSREAVKCIFGDPNLTPEEIKILQKYFKVDWKFAKSDFIYYIEPVSGTTMCKSASILYNKNSKYQFELIHINTIKEYVNRLQESKDALNRAAQQSTNRVQCSSSKITIASGHLEDRTINFRRRSKAQIGKANLSF